MRYLPILTLLLLPLSAAAQNSYNRWDARPPDPIVPLPRNTGTRLPKPAPEAAPAPTDSVVLTTGKYLLLEVTPTFPGGQQNLLAFIKKNLKRPPGPKQHGQVMVQFTVLASGAVTGAHVEPGRGLSPAYDAAAVDVISRLPSYSSPGKRRGEAVAMELTVPVEFK
ncbi:energy transducer TonB [Hymenobacter sp. NST-14]|uniref:energy transducer TonB family protein n=1 Tax=Hymenobacter piscis TaxID=2839984 RepID=UPI001C018D79|nr:energy transducer TonB [Hymenobacter piscis]MBT9392227.1 energy transducer TonB [Hymenobacter piscis]